MGDGSVPEKLSYHVRDYYFGERLIPDLLGKADVPDGVVAETWEISDYRDTTGRITNGAYAGRTLHDLVAEFRDELVREGWRLSYLAVTRAIQQPSCCPLTHTLLANLRKL